MVPDFAIKTAMTFAMCEKDRWNKMNKLQTAYGDQLR